jgi:hypothetical protein
VRPRWSWAGASVLVLAVFFLLNSVGGVLAGAITAYIGGHIASMHKRNEKLTDEDDPPPPPV